MMMMMMMTMMITMTITTSQKRPCSTYFQPIPNPRAPSHTTHGDVAQHGAHTGRPSRNVPFDNVKVNASFHLSKRNIS